MRAKCARTEVKLARNCTQTGVREALAAPQKPPFWSSTRGSSEHHKCLCALSSEATKIVRARCKRLSQHNLGSARLQCARGNGPWRPCWGARNPRAMGRQWGRIGWKIGSDGLPVGVDHRTAGPVVVANRRSGEQGDTTGRASAFGEGRSVFAARPGSVQGGTELPVPAYRVAATRASQPVQGSSSGRNLLGEGDGIALVRDRVGGHNPGRASREQRCIRIFGKDRMDADAHRARRDGGDRSGRIGRAATPARRVRQRRDVTHLSNGPVEGC